MENVIEKEIKTKSGRGGYRPNGGRPVGSIRPSGKKRRGFYVSDEEYDKLHYYLLQLRRTKEA